MSDYSAVVIKDEQMKRKAMVQLASELKKRCPSEQRLNDLVPKAIRAKADINEALPYVLSKDVNGRSKVNLKNIVEDNIVSDTILSLTDEEIATDAQTSADDSVESGSDVEIPNALPLNPLQQAAYNGHRPSIKVLLNHNVDIDRRVEAPGFEFSNLSAIQIAEQRGHHKSARLIQDYAEYAHAQKCGDSNNTDMEDECNAKSGYNSGDLSVDTSSVLPLSPVSSRSSSPPTFTTISNRSRGVSDDFSIENYSTVGIGTADGYKRPTEDRVVVAKMYEQIQLYCVFDGHGGRHYADFVAKQLPPRIRQGVIDLIVRTKRTQPEDRAPLPEEYAAVLEEAFLEIDSKLVEHSERMSLLKVGGTTAVATLVTPTHIISANVGDSPCVVFDAATGHLLRESVNHTPDNADEAQRVVAKGGDMVIGEDSGDLRLLSRTGHLGITRAFGQVGFKQGLKREEQVLSGAPQTYIWSRIALQEEMKQHFNDKMNRKAHKFARQSDVKSSFEQQRLSKVPSRPHLFLAMYSDSFTEALCDHPGGLLEETTGRPKQIITNCLSNETVLVLFSDVLRSNDYNCAVSADYLAQKQQNKFQFGGQCYGDNTSLILVDLENHSHPISP